MSLESFFIDYGTDGMYPRYGGDAGLVREMEILGIGMEVDGEWAFGGPVVWKRPNGARVIGWIRGVAKHELGRAGACRAWGVQSYDDDKIFNWPWQWEMLKSEPSLKGLEELVSALRSPRTPSLPKLNDGFEGLLSEAYRRRARGENGQTLYIPLQSNLELSDLAWFWLLGPENLQSATLGPPRRDKAAVAPPLTYAGQIGTWRPNVAVSDYIKNRLVHPARRRSYQDALQAADAIRQMPLDELRSVIDPPEEMRGRTVSIASGTNTREREQGGEEEPATKEAIRRNIPEWRNWATFGLVFIQTALLIVLAWKLWRSSPPPPSLPVNTAPAAVGTPPTVTDATTVATSDTTMPTTTDELRSDVVGIALHSALRRPRQNVRYAAAVTTWINNPRPSTTRADILRARTAALQVYFARQDCGPEVIDGLIGPGFYDSVHCLGRKGDSLEVLKSDQTLIDWLQTNP